MDPVTKIKALNGLLKDYATKNKVSFVDYYTPFVDERGGLPQKYSSDGVHPNLDGYKIMEKLVGDELVKSKIRATINQ